jgi:hypothetical protein
MSQPNQQTTTLSPVEEVLKPILYADIFDFPLTFDEIYRFLEFKAAPEEVKTLLEQAVAQQRVIQMDGFYAMAGRPHLVNKRLERRQAAQALWPRAIYYGRWIASLPFVRMVSVTGALAVENPRDGVDDIDYLIVTRSRRLWLCRALIILLVRLGHLRGAHLCPNYLLTENVLYFEDNNLFVAREMLQMVPLYGYDSYLKMRRLNTWVTDYLPHSNGMNLDKLSDHLQPGSSALKKLGEFIWGGRVGDGLESLLQKIQITKHTHQAQKYNALDKVIFTADTCKGHYNSHNSRTMRAYQARMQMYGVGRGSEK